MNIKVGNSVKIISGDAKGQTGTVLKLLRSRTGRTLGSAYTHVVVEGVNVRQRNRRPAMGQPGRVQTITKPIHISNVNLSKEVKKADKKVSDKKVNKNK